MAKRRKNPVAAFLPSEPMAPRPPKMTRQDRRWFWAILGLAAVLRMGYFVGHAKTIYFFQPVLEAQYYFEAASNLADGVKDLEASAFHPFFYPWLLGPLYSLLNPPVRLPITYILQHGMGVLTVALVFLLAFRVSGRQTAILAALLTATYGPLAAFANETLPVTLVTLLFTAIVFFLVCAAASYGIEFLIMGGLALALCGLTDPGVYFFLPFALVRLLTIPPPARAVGPPFRGPGEDLLAPLGRWANVVLFLTPPLLGVIFYGIIVSAETGHFAVLPWRAGVHFYLGNGPFSDGVYLDTPQRSTSEEFLLQSPVEEFAVAVMNNEPEPPVSGLDRTVFWFGRSFASIATNPLRWVSLVGKKALLVASHHEGSNQASYGFLRHINPFARHWYSTYGLISFLAIMGVATAVGVVWPWPRHWLWLFLVAQILAMALFFVDDASRAQIVPLLSVFAAIGAQRIWHHRGHRRSRRRAMLLRGAPLCAVLVAVIGVDWFGVANAHPGRNWWRYAWAAYQAGEWDVAARACDRAVDLGERRPMVFVCRGNLYFREGALEEALDAYEQAMLIHPDHPEAYFMAAKIFLQREQYETAVSLLKMARQTAPRPLPSEYRSEFGILALRAGDLRAANEELSLALSLAPDNVAALTGLAEINRREGDMMRYGQLIERAQSTDTALATIYRDQIGKPIPEGVMEVEPFRLLRKLNEELEQNRQ